MHIKEKIQKVRRNNGRRCSRALALELAYIILYKM
jgi:hypothetical protein